MTRRLVSFFFVFMLAATMATRALAQQSGQDASGMATDARPLVAINGIDVNGHDVRLHVQVQGATVGVGAPSTMSMDMGMNMDMGDDMSADQMGGSSMDMGLPQAHLHVYVDGTMALMAEQPDITLTNVPSGTHEIRIDLSDNLHRDWDPPVRAATTISVP
jgi:hypothetical protein